ncbi:TlpA disulfide reductase family protein [Nitrosomonas communis]|uniref:TlpA family protein disulfide reductase n=1 Tax=Nitrosomonas communis TaxID=44574 RepID=UPI0026EE2BFA|nr:TlpA disulfide reductase family protein [Nitrosomonas communis]MCO6427571.1 TlpA family protein disulfide reductase [Nitrosomonas communis]
MKHFFLYLFLVMNFLSFCVQAEEFQFKFEDSKGKIHQLSDYRGKWVLVNFWATWCPPCLKEIPDLISLYKDRNNIMILGIAMDYEDSKTVMEYAEALSIPYPIVLGDRWIASQLDELSMLPSTYLFDPEGKPAARKIGLLTREDIEKFIQSY